MKRTIKKGLFSFATSTTIALICLLLVEVISAALGYHISPLTPEFVNLFPTGTIALGVDLLIYGFIGFVFSTLTFIYEIDRLGFILQNILYCIATAIFWIPLIIFIWQLQRYPQALISTFIGFVACYMIIMIIQFITTKKEVAIVNHSLQKNLE